MALPILQLGSEHDTVVKLRERLTALGFDAGTAVTTEPRVFDSAVESAVRAFQSKVSLMPDGVVGPDTWAKLGADAGAGPGVVVSGPSWLKLGLMAAALYFGWKWWKNRKAGGEFQHRIAGYGDEAIDNTLIEEPLLLMERGDCHGAVRLLKKRRSYVAAGTPKNKQLFRKVIEQVADHCGKEVADLINEDVWEEEEGEGLRAGAPGDIVSRHDRDMSRLRRKRGDPNQWWNEPYRIPGNPQQSSLPFVRRGQRPFPRSGGELRPHTGSGARVVFIDASGREQIGTVKRESAGGMVSVSVGGSSNVQVIPAANVVRWLPVFQRPRAPQTGRTYTPEQKVKMNVASAKARAAKNAEKARVNALTRSGLRRESAAGGRASALTRTVIPADWDDSGED